MSTQCYKCEDPLIHNEDTIECSICKNQLHFYCAGFSESNFKKMSRNTKSRFQCNRCQCDNSKAKSLEANITKGNDGKLEDIIKSIKFMGAQFDDFNVKIDTVLEEMKNMKAEYKKILVENKILKEEVEILKIKVDDLEQRNIGHSVEIKGVTKTINENCLDIVQVIAAKGNSDIIINSAYRINTPGDSTGIIIAELKTFEMKKDFLRKVKNMKMTADTIFKDWSADQKIFVNERLTKTRRILFSKTRALCKEKQYKFAWISNTEILVKKNEGSKTIRIKSEADFYTL